MIDILIIEHDAATKQFLVSALKQQGYSLATARSGIEGLAMAEKLLPGVIICDWNLPGTTNALAICQTIKRHPLLSITSLLLLTARYRRSALQARRHQRA